MQAPVTSFRMLACMYLPLLGALGSLEIELYNTVVVTKGDISWSK